MKRVLRYAVVLGLVLTGTTLICETQATCSFARLFNSSNPAGYSYVYTPGLTPGPTSTTVSGDLVGSFWMLGNGVPGAAMGQGIDNGRFQAIVLSGPGYFYYGWIRGFPYYGAYIQGPSWASSPDVDLCPDQVVGQRCMAMVLTDQVNGVGFFAFLTDEADASQNYDFVQPGNGPINLIQIPKPAIISSNRPNSNTVELIVAGPSASTLAAGLFLDPNCSSLGDITGYKIRSQRWDPNCSSFGKVASNCVPNFDRDVSNWRDVTPGGGTVPLGQSTLIPIDCSSDANVYLVTSLVFDSGFELGLISESSSRVSCSVILAEPEPLNRKPGRRPDRKTKR
jgi:hypothetical protein